jgi:hypothetical protein
LYAVVALLAQFMQQAAGIDMGTSSSSTTTSSRSAPSSELAATGSISREQRLALAAGMPAAYSSMLEQLGCSREMGVWMAEMLLNSTAVRIGSDGLGSVYGNVLAGLHQYCMVLGGLVLDAMQAALKLPDEVVLLILDNCCAQHSNCPG